MSEIIGDAQKAELANGIYRNGGLLTFGNAILRNGSWSPFYMDVRPIPSISEDLARTDMTFEEQLTFRRSAVGAYGLLLDSVGDHQHIMSIPEATDHLVGMIGFATDRSVLKRRVKSKEHGKKAEILGFYKQGDVAAFVDDVITSSDAKIEEKERIEQGTALVVSDDGEIIEPGLVVNDAAILVDREQGGIEAARARGLNVVAALTVSECIEIPHEEGVMPDEAYAIIQGFRSGQITSFADVDYPTWPLEKDHALYLPHEIFGRTAA